MSSTNALDILPKRSLSARRWDYICVGILVLPLVVLAFQGTIIVAIAEQINYQGWFTPIHEREATLADVREQSEALNHEKYGLDPQGSRVDATRYLEIQAQIRTLKSREDDLVREIRALREPIERIEKFWNFSFVNLWPLLLLLCPVLVLLLWLSHPRADRERMYDQALGSGARTRGLLLGLAGVGVLWVGAYLEHRLSADRLENLGTGDWTAPLHLQYGFLVTYASLVMWTVGFIYAFAGREGLCRMWLPMIVVLALMILHYAGPASRWFKLWDTDERWGYGYFIGPLAAAILFFQVSEKRSVASSTGPVPGVDEVGGGLSWRGEIPRRAFRADWRLLLWGAGLVVLTFLGILVGEGIGIGASARTFSRVPYAIAGAMILLGLWQLVDRNRRSETAMRIVGAATLLGALYFRYLAGDSGIAYFVDITFIGVLLGGALMVFGFHVFRVTWVPLAFLLLAIPWPERIYTDIAQHPQVWAATMATRMMNLVGFQDMWREGNILHVLPGPEGELVVAEACSGLKMLFAFVALSVFHAFMRPRPPWRRAIIFFSAFPIATVANFVRVFAMAFFFRIGYRQIVTGLEHTLAGFVIMLPMAFGLLWLEMRFLDLIEYMIEVLTTDEPDQSDGPGGPDGPGDENSGQPAADGSPSGVIS